MKIAWFSPLPPLKSGISEYSELIVSYLKNIAQVDLWVDGFVPTLDLYSQHNIIDYKRNATLLRLLNKYDTVIYNIGNNIEFHGSIYETFRKYPGIVILHDYVLHGLFWGYYFLHKKDSESYFLKLNDLYGSKVSASVRKNMELYSKAFVAEEEEFNYPLNEDVIFNAKGIIVHSNFIHKLIRNCSKEIVTIKHPFFPVEQVNYVSRKDLNLPEDKIILMFFGFINPNKRIDKVLEIIATNDFLKNNLYIVILGENIIESYDLKSYVNKLNLSQQVCFTGYLSINETYQYLYSADICGNLRMPTMGETSGSLIRIMYLGKPTLVTNIGSYAELPDNCVVKIDPEKEKEQIEYWLGKLIRDEKLRYNIGNNARNYILENHSPELFVKKLINFIKKIKQKEKETTYFNLIDKVSNTLNEIGQFTDQTIAKIATEIAWTKYNKVRDFIPLEYTFGHGGNTLEYQEEGWSTPEKHFTWTDGDKATLILPLNECEFSIMLKIQLFPFLVKDKLKKQRVNVIVNNNKITEWVLTEEDRHEKELIISSDLLEGKLLYLTFELPDAASPQSFELSDDTRQLGIAISSISITQLNPYQFYLGVPLSFKRNGNASLYMGSGWSNPEGNGTWTCAEKAELRLPFKATEANLVLKITAQPFLLPGIIEKQRLRLYINKEMIGEATFKGRDLQDKEFEVPSSILNGFLQHVTFELPDAISPAAIGFGNEKRKLGLFMHLLQISQKEFSS